MSDTKLVQFNCPVKLLEVFDEVIADEYSDRTNGLLEAMRLFIRTLEERKEKEQ